MWTQQDVAILATKASVRIGSASALSFAIGAISSYFVVNKKLELKYEQTAKLEIAEAKVFYQRLYPPTERLLTPEEVLEEIHGKEAVKALQNYQGVLSTEVSTDPRQVVGRTELHDISLGVDSGPRGGHATPVTKNIFTEAETHEGDFNYELELVKREENPDKPYIISQEEFFANEKEYEQVSLTYFEGDDVLADDKSSPVPDPEATVGEDNLTRFGHGSKDNTIVYIRNEALEMDFEISHSSGLYTKEVLGFDVVDDDTEIKHSHRRGVTKFREYDE